MIQTYTKQKGTIQITIINGILELEGDIGIQITRDGTILASINGSPFLTINPEKEKSNV